MTSDNRIGLVSGRPAFRRALVCILFLLAAMLAAPQASAQPETAEIAIEAQPLENALIELSEQTGIGIFARGDLVEGLQAPPLSGSMSMEDALRQLLSDTGLTFQRNDDGSYVVLANASAAIGQRQPGIEEIIVTGQKREERIQDVPIAISAFSPEDLEAQKIEGGFDLLKGVPNVTFSKTNFSGYNFQIRGIGTQAVSATTDPGVAVSFNNTTLIVNRLFEQEYLDVERVEVLRGPQGTLFGRNATAGVINVISKKPELGVWDGMIDVEVGNYNTRRLRGFFNAPIGDQFAIRGAYASTKRDGYGTNLAASEPFADVRSDVDGRDLWTGRLSLSWQPHDRFRANLIWERFEEDDNRVRTSKQLCHRDPSPDGIGSVPWPQGDNTPLGIDTTEYTKATLSQGCQPGSLYSDEAYGTPNGASLPYVAGLFHAQDLSDFAGSLARGDRKNSFAAGPNPFFQGSHFDWGAFGVEDAADAPCPIIAGDNTKTYSLDLCNPDPYGGRMQSRDLREIYSLLEPEYRAEADIVEFSFDFEVADNLLLSSQTVYAKDEYYATQDYNRFTTFPIWNGDGAANACGTTVFNGKTEVDCTEPGEEFFVDGLFGPTPTGSFYSGRGSFLPLTDAEDLDGDGTPDGDGNIDQGMFGSWAQHGFTVDDEGFIRNPEDDDNRVGYYNLLLNEGGPNTICDPQLGCSDKLVLQDLSRAKSTQYNQEFRLVSSYPGDWNFSLGANFTKFRTLNDYFVFGNSLTHLLHFWPFNDPLADEWGGCPLNSNEGRFCRYVDPNPLEDIDGEGHNYFRSANPYKLTSSALFGEAYWNATDTVKVTLGLRMTWDQKVFTPIPSQLLLADYRDQGTFQEGDPPTEGAECALNSPDCPLTGNAPGGRGSPSQPNIVQEWNEPTGRLVVDWSPVLGFTDETMVYASYAHGYKGGGANPPGVAPPSGNILALASGADAPKTFEPEFVNAYEVGTKNTLFGGALVLNGTAFYYDYTDYQVSKIVDRSAANENFDAEVRGAELEAIFAPSLDWQFNAAIGYLSTEIASGEKSIDLMDRAQGGDRFFVTGVENANFDPSLDPRPIEDYVASTADAPREAPADQEFLAYDKWLVIKPWVTAASNCVVPEAILEQNLQKNFDGQARNAEFNYCPAGGLLGPLGNYDPSAALPNNGAGFFADLSGNELPNAPHLTVALGGQYNFDLTRDWRATARVDYYWQDESYARVYNTEYDRLKSWSNTNLSFWVTNPVNGITVEGYVKNVFNETPITGTFLNSDDSGLTTNVFTLDPRLIGVSIRKEF